MFVAESKNDHFKRTCLYFIFRLSDYKDEKKPCFVRNRALSLHIKLFQLILNVSRKYKRTS